MKKLVIVALALSATLSAADFSGIWNGKGGIENPKYGAIPQIAQLTILQADNRVTGTLKIGNGKPMAISAGTSSGAQLSFVVTSFATGTLNQNGDKLQGRLTSSRGEIFDVIFTKQ